MATILVTGGAGYVGSHACKALAAAGHVPVTYDSLYRGHREFVKWGPLEVGDILDRARLDEVMARHKPDAVMHFAALALIDESVAHPALYERNNVAGTRCLLAAMAAAHVKHMVVSSSCTIYGVSTRMPLVETEPCVPINPYGESKLAMERLVAAEEKTNGLAAVALRYFNAAGAETDAGIGEWHDPETHLIPNVLDAALGLTGAVTIHGADYPTADGTCVRDYVHVADIADAHARALEHAMNRGSAVFNLGTGSGYSVRQVIDAVRSVTGKDIPVKIGARRPGDPPVLVADASRARAALGWSPQRSDLTTMIADAWAWHQRMRSAPAPK